MKRAFTLIELIFVMIIFGVLATIGIYSFKPKNLQNDVNYVYMKIQEARYQGINYDKAGLTQANTIGCIDLTQNALEDMAKKDRYTIKSDIQSFVTTLCFDSFGRPHIDDNLTTPSSLVTQKRQLLTLQGRNRSAKISVLPQSGYVIIEYN